MSWVAVFCGILAIIVVHEAGHLLVSFLFKIPVLCFSVGFGPKLWKRRFGDTIYAISAVPLGGYIRCYTPFDPAPQEGGGIAERLMAAMMPPDDDINRLRDELRSGGARFQDPPVWKQICILGAGSAANIVMGFACCIAAQYWILPRMAVGDRPVILGVEAKSPAEKAGFKAGDVVVSVMGKPVKTWGEVWLWKQRAGGRKMRLGVERAGKTLEIEAVPAERRIKREGIVFVDHSLGLIARQRTGWEMTPHAVSYGLWTAATIVWDTVNPLKYSETAQARQEDPRARAVRGPVTGLNEAVLLVQDGPGTAWMTLGVLSIVIALLNLLPIPALDGGLIAMCLYQAAIGRELNRQRVRRVNQAGLFFMVLLFAYVLLREGVVVGPGL